MEPVIAGSSPVRHPYMEDTAKWMATGLENQGWVTPGGSIPLSSLSTESREARHCADNAEVGGAVPPRWIAHR